MRNTNYGGSFKMKKKFIAVVLISSMVMSLIGCGKTETTTTATTELGIDKDARDEIQKGLDLLKAKDMLYSLIDEMDEVMKNDFYETFKELQVEFKKVFRSLFKGGDASLTLTDPDNLMETGVDIVASPPGKKLKTITLLSGGEKTLTAISLLFAILNIRQVPFCVFDEVEAALDEANVDNFGSYLHSYKDKTQFLLITHKKRTMEYAKTLYGITMQESGVSKLVSVKLEDKLENEEN